MSLDDEDPGNGLDIVPGSHGISVPSTCTIVIVKGLNDTKRKEHPTDVPYFLGKYLNRVDSVMTKVDKIAEDIEHIPVAAFIFRDSESVMVNYSSEKRSSIKIKVDLLKFLKFQAP